MRWNEVLRKVLLEIEDRLDALDAVLRPADRPVVVPYRGYGTPRRVWVRGRVIDEMRIEPAQANSSLARNLRDTWLRFASREVAGARVSVEISGSSTEVTTDSEGYFDLEMDLRDERIDPGWMTYRVKLVEPKPVLDHETASGAIRIPSPNARFGVVSDVDDTIIESGATSRFRMLHTLVTGNAWTRLPVEGIAALFRELRDDGERGLNPFFYVSSGPWNLFGFLDEFFEIQKLPRGPLLLQDYGLDETKLICSDHDDHKLEQIARIVGTYPHLAWILVGDTGQRDPEIYTAIAEEFPERVLGIVVRDVNSEPRDTIVWEVLAPLDDLEIPYAVVRTAEEAGSFIQAQCLPRTRPGHGL